MRKIITVINVIMLLLALCACGNKNKENEVEDDPVIISGVANPMVEKDSLETINSEVGTNIKAPAVMGKSNEKFYVINGEIAQYNFTLSGYNWTIRGANNIEEDICGIYDEHILFESGVPSTTYLNDYYIERYFDGEYQYTFVVDNPENLDEETFSNIVYELEQAIIYDEVLGDYVDTVTQRATAVVEKNNGIFYVLVDWPSSANEMTEWIMECKKEDGKLTYNGENFATYIYDDNGDVTVCGDGASNNVGFFEIIDGKLYWTGAAREECRALIFEKVD